MFKQSQDPITRGFIVVSLPGARVVDCSMACLLGSPLGDEDSVSATIKEKLSSLKVMGGRLEYFSAHDALLLVQNFFSIPKLLYVLRTVPCFCSPTSYDISVVLGYVCMYVCM